MIAVWISLGAVCVLALAVFFWCSNNALKVTHIKLNVDGAPKLKIVHLSDLHGKRFAKRNTKLIAKVAAHSPDFIAFTGDIVHKYRPRDIEVALEAVCALKEVAPLLYVSGNHEMRSKGYRDLRKCLKEAGATVLDNDVTFLCGITVAGVNCAHLRNATLHAITPQVSPKILLSHEPQFFEKYVEEGYDAVLCGHAHGGQWRIPFTGIGIYAPGQGLFPKYTAGVYKKGATSMVVSRGLGNSEFPLRLFNRPEIIVIEIN